MNILTTDHNITVLVHSKSTVPYRLFCNTHSTPLYLVSSSVSMEHFKRCRTTHITSPDQTTSHITTLHIPFHISSQHIKLHHITPLHITPQYITSHHIIPHHTKPHHTTSHHTVSHHIALHANRHYSVTCKGLSTCN
jgi:hypothetical protein